MDPPDDITRAAPLADDPTRSAPVAADATRLAPSAGPANTHDQAADATAPEPPGLPRVPGYDILGEVGRGACGVVYQARQLALNRVVAVKLVGGAASALQLLRFRQEAEAVARLQHPNIVQVFEVGACPAGSFLALEFVDGGTLKEKVAGVPQPPPDAARVVETLARAVHHAHERRLIHRDLKPSNVLLTTGGVPKVADFGLARWLDAGPGTTLSTDFVGTPAYAAPEQVAGSLGPVGVGTDVYALGVILYELLTGRVPFEAPTIARLLRAVAEEEPASPRRLRPDLPRDLETACLKCLEKDPRRRYASAADLADDLGRFQRGEPIAARPVGRLERAARWCRRNPAVAGLLGAVFALLAAAAATATVAAVRIDQARRAADANAALARQAAADEAAAKLAAERDRDAARRAEREGKEKLLQSLVSEARAGRFSRRVGQRFNTLAAVRQAAALARELGQPEATFAELRNLAAAALALPDLRPDAAWVADPAGADRAWRAITADPDNRRVAIDHQSGEISLRRVGPGPADGGEFARLPGLGSEVRPRWSPDGRHLAVWHWQARRVQVWRTDGDRPPAVTLDVGSGCVAIEYTHDGRLLIVRETGGAGRAAQIHDPDTGTPVRSVPLPHDGWHDYCHHPTRPELAVGLPGGVAVIDLTTGRERDRLPIPNAGTLDWHPHGELLAATFANHVEVWDVQRRLRVCTVPHTGGGVEARFSRAGDLLVTTGWTTRVRVWNPYTGRPVMDTLGGAARFGFGDRLPIRFPMGKDDPAGPLTVVEPGREYRTLVPAGPGPFDGFTGCRVHPGGRLAAVSCTQGFGLFDLATGGERAFVRENLCRDVLFEPDGSLIVKSAAGVHRWPVAAHPSDPGRLRVGPPEQLHPPARGEAVAGSADGSVLAAATGGGAMVWWRDWPHDPVRVGHADCRHVAVSPDGTLLATGSWNGRGMKVWDARTGRLVRDLLPGEGMVVPVFSPDGRWLADWRGWRWTVADWSPVPDAPRGVAGLGFSPDGRLAAHSGKGFVLLADAATGRELVRLEDPHQDGMNNCEFSPDGTLMLSTTNDSFCARVWDLRKIRAGLAELGLDWDAPAYPPGPGLDPTSPPLRVEVVGEALPSLPAVLRRTRRDEAVLAVWANPFDPAARLALAHELMRAGDTRGAAAQATASTAFAPDRTGGYALRAVARFRAGDLAGAAADAAEVLARRPNDRHARSYRVRALAALGRHADAVTDLTALIAQAPTEPGPYAERAAAYLATGDVDRAAADWRRWVKLIESDTAPTAMTAMARRRLLGPAGERNPVLGLELARRAFARRPDDPTTRTTLALAHYRTGSYPDAIATLGDQSEEDAVAQSVLAMSHARLGNATQARAHYARAVMAGSSPAAEGGQLLREAAGVLHAAGVATDPAPAPRPVLWGQTP